MPRFIAAERRYIGLTARYQSGLLDRQAYREKLVGLAFQDDDGSYWTISGRDSRWHWFDGQQWVPRDPPVAGHRNGGELDPTAEG
jgi:hypothetical protein